MSGWQRRRAPLDRPRLFRVPLQRCQRGSARCACRCRVGSQVRSWVALFQKGLMDGASRHGKVGGFLWGQSIGGKILLQTGEFLGVASDLATLGATIEPEARLPP